MTQKQSRSKGAAVRCYAASLTSTGRAFFIRISNRANSITSTLPDYWFFSFPSSHPITTKTAKLALFAAMIPAYWLLVFLLILDVFVMRIFILAILGSYLVALLGDPGGLIHIWIRARHHRNS